MLVASFRRGTCLVLLMLMAGLGPLITHADSLGVDDAKGAATGLPTGWSASRAIGTVIDFLLGLTGLLALLAIVWGGFRMIIGLGNESQVESAKKIIFWAIIGLIVVGLSWAIIKLVANEILGVSV